MIKDKDTREARVLARKILRRILIDITNDTKTFLLFCILLKLSGHHTQSRNLLSDIESVLETVLSEIKRAETEED